MRSLLARAGVSLLVTSLVHCSAWHATQEPLSGLEGKRVRITAGEVERQEGELVDADSMGFAVVQGEKEFKNRYDRSAKPNHFTFDITTITVVEKRVNSPTRSIALVTSVVLVLGIAALAIVTGIENLPE